MKTNKTGSAPRGALKFGFGRDVLPQIYQTRKSDQLFWGYYISISLILGEFLAKTHKFFKIGANFDRLKFGKTNPVRHQYVIHIGLHVIHIPSGPVRTMGEGGARL